MQTTSCLLWQSYRIHVLGAPLYSKGTFSELQMGEVIGYWDCCGATNEAHPGCVAGPHHSYDED
jgi:hypothetical protein